MFKRFEMVNGVGKCGGSEVVMVLVWIVEGEGLEV